MVTLDGGGGVRLVHEGARRRIDSETEVRSATGAGSAGGRVDGEDARRNRAAALGLALDATEDAFVVLDERGIVGAANAHAAALCGLTAESLAGRRLLECLPETAAEALGPQLEVAARGERRNCDLRLTDPLDWYVGHVYPLRGGMVLHLHDITDRRREEDALAFLARAGKALASVLDERRLARVIGRLVVPHMADWSLLMLRANGRAVRHYVSAASRALRRWVHAAAERDGGALLRPRGRGAALLTDPRGGHGAADGAALRHSAASLLRVPLVDGERRVIGVLVLGRVHSNRAFLRHEVQLTTALGSRISTVLDRVRLYEAERHARQLRDDVLAIVAHDLGNPLNTIMLAATALTTPSAGDGTLHETARQTMVTAAEQMHRLLEDLLNAAQLDAGWGPRECTPVSITALVQDSARAFRSPAERKGVRLETALRGVEGVRLLADAGRLAEAVANILDNAVKFTPPGGVITLAAERVPSGVQLSVSDSGPGIEPEAMPRLFDRFWQARRSGRASAGLGLFIARRIVEGHGGSITAESTIGRGSVFRIVLPTRAAAKPRTARRGAAGADRHDR